MPAPEPPVSVGFIPSDVALRLPRQGRYWLLAVAGLLAIGWFKHINLVLLLAYLMLVLWGLNFLLAGRRLLRLEVRRRLEGPRFALEPFKVEIEVYNPERRPFYGFLLQDRGPAADADWFIVQLRAFETAHLKRQVTLPRRGAYLWLSVTAASAYPFGLVQRTLPLTPAETVYVLPHLGQVHRGRLRRFLSHTAPLAECLRTVPRPAPVAHADFHGLRPFRSGDSPRWIHWRTSARRGDLMVREYEDATTDNLVVVFDPHCPAAMPELAALARPWAHDPTFLLERAVSLAATICWEWSRQKGDRFVLAIAGAKPVVWAGVTGRDFAVQMLEALAVQQGTAEADPEALVAELLRTPLPPGPVLLVTTRDNDLSQRLSQRLHRPVAALHAAEVDDLDFYEPPGSHAS